MDDTAKRALEVLEARRAIYVTEHEAAYQNAEDCYNRWDHTKIVVEAFDLAIDELCAALRLPRPEPVYFQG